MHPLMLESLEGRRLFFMDTTFPGGVESTALMTSKGKLVIDLGNETSVVASDQRELILTRRGLRTDVTIRRPQLPGGPEATVVLARSFGGVHSIAITGTPFGNHIVIRPGVHAATIDAGVGDDTIEGGDGADTIRAGAGNDQVHGGGGDDVLFGEGGKDRLYGDGGDDVLNGGASVDRLDGGSGANKLAGGAGSDVITFRSSKDKFDRNDRTDRLVDQTPA